MPHIHIIGTSHIAEDSVNQIKKDFLQVQPNIIAVELDKNRLDGLMNADENTQNKSLPLSAIKHIGLTGYVFAIIGRFAQKKLGNMVGTNPGADMKQAALLAKNNHLQLLLLDQDLRITLKKLSKSMKGKEKRRLLFDVFFGWTQKKNKQIIKIDLAKVPQEELIAKLLEHTKERYPSLYKVLVHDRNVFMAKRLATASIQHPQAKFLVVIGAGHKEGFLEEFKKEYEHLRQEVEKHQAQQKDQTTQNTPS